MLYKHRRHIGLAPELAIRVFQVCTAVITVVVDSKFMTRLRVIALEDIPLWDIWYTGSMLFPSEIFNAHVFVILNGCKLIRSLFFSPKLINPSPRASILAGLVHPHISRAAK